ncbi:MAG: DEAD/DEAH box helicase [Parachlamydiaceae bacterium]
MLDQPIFSINESETRKQKSLYLDVVRGILPSPLKILNLKNIPFDKSYDALKLIMIHGGALYFREKRLVIDLFGKAQFYYCLERKDGQLVLSGGFKIRQHDFSLLSIDLLTPGRPSWFIKDYHLFVIDPEISSSTFSCLPTRVNPTDIPRIEEDAREDNIPFVNHLGISLAEKEPLPILILKDKTGAFANLNMDYGHTTCDFNDPSSLIQRNKSCEIAWEKDLLETDFIKKQVGTTHYYCPLDKVTKSLGFLLEIGWAIYDCNGKKVVKETGNSLHADLIKGQILLTGKIHYASYSVDLKNVAGTFLKRDRFLSLNDNTVGLLEESPTYQNFLNEGSLLDEGVVVNRYSLKELLDTEQETKVQFSDKIKSLRDRPVAANLGSAYLFEGQLRHYQKQGVEWLCHLYQLQLGAILADDMGLGKTIQVLAFIARLGQESRHLIVVPTSLLFNWQLEIKRFLPNTNLILHHGPLRTKQAENLPEEGIILTSYTTLRIDKELFTPVSFNCLILDEAQVIKNQDTKTFCALQKLDAYFKVSLTGTPIENHVEEIFSQFRFLMPGFLNEQDWLLKGISNQRFFKRLQKKIQPFILRRRKEEVATDLPEKIEQTIFLEMSPQQREIYENYLKKFKNNTLKKVALEGSKNYRIEIFEALLRLRQICCHPLLINAECPSSSKLDILLEDLETIVQEGHKALVFSQFTSMLSLIGQALTKKNLSYVRLDGNTKNREHVVDEFQNGKVPLFLISLKAGGVGLNLTAADHVFIFDPWWNEAIENQAISRAHRIGQRKSVFAKRYVMSESIEEKILKLKEQKNKLISDLLNEDLSMNDLITTEDLLLLFEE